MKDYATYANRYRANTFETVLSKVRSNVVLRSMREYPHEHILEVGCALNPIFQYCEFKTYTVVEPNSDFVVNAQLLCKEKTGVTILQDLLENVYTSLGGYDFIILNSVLHEVPNPEELLDCVYYIANDDTTVHVNVTNSRSLHRLLGYEMNILKTLSDKTESDISFQRCTSFDMTKLATFVERSGFSVLSQGSYFIKPFSNEQMGAMMKQGLINEDTIMGLEKLIKYLPNVGVEIYVDAKKTKGLYHSKTDK